MEYELLEYQWISDSNYSEDDKASNRFNRFALDHKRKFEVVSSNTVSHLNSEGKTVETTFIMIKWIDPSIVWDIPFGSVQEFIKRNKDYEFKMYYIDNDELTLEVFKEYPENDETDRFSHSGWLESRDILMPVLESDIVKELQSMVDIISFKEHNEDYGT